MPRVFAVGVNRTTSIIFPASIVSVDRGSEKIIIQKATNYILKVKAESNFSDTTSLTVVTSDGKLYPFLVHFNLSAAALTIQLGRDDAINRDTSLDVLDREVRRFNQNLFGVSFTEGKVRLSLTGVYSTGELVLCRFRLENHSSLSYAVGGLQVVSKESSIARRASAQERKITPVFFLQQEMVVREKSVQVFVIFLPKPTLNLSRSLEFRLSEKDGERNLVLQVRNKFLIKAVLIR